MRELLVCADCGVQRGRAPGSVTCPACGKPAVLLSGPIEAGRCWICDLTDTEPLDADGLCRMCSGVLADRLHERRRDF